MSKRILMSVAGAALLVGVVGCGSSGVTEGAPQDLKPGVIPDPNMVNPTGKMGAGVANKAAAKSNEASASGGGAPAEKK